MSYRTKIIFFWREKNIFCSKTLFDHIFLFFFVFSTNVEQGSCSSIFRKYIFSTTHVFFKRFTRENDEYYDYYTFIRENTNFQKIDEGTHCSTFVEKRKSQKKMCSKHFFEQKNIFFSSKKNNFCLIKIIFVL